MDDLTAKMSGVTTTVTVPKDYRITIPREIIDELDIDLRVKITIGSTSIYATLGTRNRVRVPEWFRDEISPGEEIEVTVKNND